MSPWCPPKYPCDPFYRRMHSKLRAYYYPKPTAESVCGHLIEHSLSLLWGSVLTLWIALRHGFLRLSRLQSHGHSLADRTAIQDAG